MVLISTNNVVLSLLKRGKISLTTARLSLEDGEKCFRRLVKQVR
ncbi:unnamed protein product [marine sediment metagenome]|uniref:Uncharacterized protein n=1 Tax=marine sediment metagenome TaxID=412755 RepID=X1C0X1_9ZZZZ